MLVFLIEAACITCEQEKKERDHSGIYCLNILQTEMILVQTGNKVTFTTQTDILVDGTGTATGDTLLLTANTFTGEAFTALIVFSPDGHSFSGHYQVADTTGTVKQEGLLTGSKGNCVTYDINANGIPEFITEDFMDLTVIERISRFRSGIGHSSTDGFETCRSMKHYYAPYEAYRENNTVGLFAPVTGTIISVPNDGHGISIGLKNKQIHICPDDQPAFLIVLFHCDLLSSAIQEGKKVQAGELLGYARMYYEDLNEHADNFDVAVWVNTPSGPRMISYFETMQDAVFASYIARGAVSRQDFIITRQERDADPLQCDGEAFLNSGQPENWVVLH